MTQMVSLLSVSEKI